MTDHDQVPEPTELIHLPRASWAPALFAFGVLGVIGGIFAEGFLFRGWVYMIAGAVLALWALRAMVKLASREFYELPRRQRPSTAVLPAASLKPPPKT
jgi:hypothetical protein